MYSLTYLISVTLKPIIFYHLKTCAFYEKTDDDDDDDDDEMFLWYGILTRGVFSLIFIRDHCQRSSLSRISDTPRAGFEPVQSLSSHLVE